MSLARKTLAKYGAQIPVGPSTGAKQAQPGKQDASVEAPVKAEPKVKQGGAKKR